MSSKYMIIDNIQVELADEKNVLEVVRKAGIELPTFCYQPELAVYGACRLCVVEDKRGSINASCGMIPYDGMVVFTNTPRLRKYRKMILELLLAHHCRDCTACDKNGQCKLQEFARRFGVETNNFENDMLVPNIDDSSHCITKDKSKCILCGNCVRVCNDVQNVGAIVFPYRSSKVTVSTAFDEPLAESNCVGCGQCTAVCPTGAMMIKNHVSDVWKELHDENTMTIAQIAPAVRVAVGKEFGLPEGSDTMPLITAALKRMGFDKVFDTCTAADLTVLEETSEFIKILASGSKETLFTSCCPGWVNFAETKYPEVLAKNVSSCRSPIQMMGAVIKEYYKDSDQKVVNVSITPCTAKKHEATRDEFKDQNGNPEIDLSITTQELIQMIREAGIVFAKLQAAEVDAPFGVASGAGVIFGVTGGVTEAVIRKISEDKSAAALESISFIGVRGMDGVKETSLDLDGKEVKIAVVSGLGNVDQLIKKMKKGEVHYDFVEVMACPGGCICGAGQPVAQREEKLKRSEGIYQADQKSDVKFSEQNPVMKEIYDTIIRGKEHELLHVHYKSVKNI